MIADAERRFCGLFNKLREENLFCKDRSFDSRFSGNPVALEKVLAAKPDVINSQHGSC